MGLRIATNITSIAAQNKLAKTTREQNDTLTKLASGSRINKSADDAAGLAISEKLKAEIRGTNQATRNANDGISMIQVAEGGMNEISNALIRLRELSVQSASDTIGEKERAYTDLEFQQLTGEIERIAQSTKFNGKSLLNGQGGVYDFQIGTMNSPENDRISFDSTTSNVTGAEIGIEGLSVASKESAQDNLVKIDEALNKVNGNRAVMGALQNRLQSTVNNLEVKTENLSAANSRIRDTDVAKASADLAKSNIMSNAGSTVLGQANASLAHALKLIG